MGNNIGYRALQLPSFSDSNQASAQALSIALKGAQYEEANRKEQQQNLLGQQLGEQLLVNKGGNVNKSDLLSLALNSEGSLKENLGMVNSLQNLLGGNGQTGKLSDVEKQLFKTKKDQDTLAFKQRKEDRARFAKLPDLAQAFAQPFVDRVSGDSTPFMDDADKRRAKDSLVSLFMQTGGDPELIDLVRRNAESSLEDEQSLIFDTDFDVEGFGKNTRSSIANALQLKAKRKK